jgi:hypothetical protein
MDAALLQLQQLDVLLTLTGTQDHPPRLGLVRIRDGDGTVVHATPRLRAVIEASNEITTMTEVVAAAGGDTGLIEELTSMGALYCEGNQVLNLAVCVGRTDVRAQPLEGVPRCAPDVSVQA